MTAKDRFEELIETATDKYLLSRDELANLLTASFMTYGLRHAIVRLFPDGDVALLEDVEAIEGTLRRIAEKLGADPNYCFERSKQLEGMIQERLDALRAGER